MPINSALLAFVTDQVNMRAKAVSIKQHPTQDCDHDQPDHLHGEISAHLANQRRVKDSLLNETQREISALREHQHRPPP